MKCETPEQVALLARDACQVLLGHARKEEVSLLVGTAAYESMGFRYRRQLGDGPARGLWQMELATAQDIFRHYLSRKKNLLNRLIQLWLGFPEPVECPGVWIPEQGDLDYFLREDDEFACALARIHYLRFSEPIPKTVGAQARYWKQYYNTKDGAGTTEKYLKAWQEYNCDALVEIAMSQ